LGRELRGEATVENLRMRVDNEVALALEKLVGL